MLCSLNLVIDVYCFLLSPIFASPTMTFEVSIYKIQNALFPSLFVALYCIAILGCSMFYRPLIESVFSSTIHYMVVSYISTYSLAMFVPLSTLQSLLTVYKFVYIIRFVFLGHWTCTPTTHVAYCRFLFHAVIYYGLCCLDLCNLCLFLQL